ncbi:10180_t:CDS:1, partial [Ambispora leptoticha]
LIRYQQIRGASTFAGLWIDTPLYTSKIDWDSKTGLATHVAKCFASDVETVSGLRIPWIT